MMAIAATRSASTFTAYHYWRGKPPGAGTLLILNPHDALKRRQREASAPLR
jgi:hypothetical protein